jgi:hypothetical protein
LAIADAVVLVPVVPDCWQDARNAMPIRTAIREITCFFIDSTSRGAESLIVLNQVGCWEWVCVVRVNNRIVQAAEKLCVCDGSANYPWLALQATKQSTSVSCSLS